MIEVKKLTPTELDIVLTVSRLKVHFKEFEEYEKKNNNKKIKSD